MDDLSSLSEQIISDHSLDSRIKGWLMVEINNCAWSDTVASIPYSKRILLLPKCLNHSTKCKAIIDELGLLCHRCNHCSIPDLQNKADDLGMMSIVAEGFTSIIELIENRVVDTVIGVSCLDSLEKAFPLLINNAVPGLAVPLNMAGCKDTTVDYEYVNRLMTRQSDKESNLLDYDLLKSVVKEWFLKENLSENLSASAKLPSYSESQTSLIAHEWLGENGKRWRPFLLAATYLALSGEKTVPKAVQKAAIAVECFHKASLVHDDIQDHDAMRYGKPTVHAVHGVPIAINIGDILLGEGYRLLTGCDNIKLLKVAVDAHISLCKGQGMELEWSRTPRPLTMNFVLDIFSGKTVPAFDVSLIMGVICAGDDAKLRTTLHNYSHAFGIAYQLLDDVADFETDKPVALRPSAILAALCEMQTPNGFIDNLLKQDDPKSFLHLPENEAFLNEAIRRVNQMVEQYRSQALEALREITNSELKRLLFRMTKRILN
jgi:geranylgeranyl pyrophosphate synthase